MPGILGQVFPTGGVIGLTLTVQATGDWTITRQASHMSPVVIGSGTSEVTGTFYFLDVGDDTPAPLLPSSTYTYFFAGPDGTTETPPLTPVASITLEPDPMTRAFIRLLQGAFNTMELPDGVSKPNVMEAMPLTGFPAMPFCVIYPELLQQEQVPIGGDVPDPDQTGTWQKHEIVRRVYRVSVLARNAVEREFLRDMVIAVYRSSLAYFLSQIGQDMTQRWQAASYQVSSQTQLQVPGFYGSDIMLDFSGVLELPIQTNYGIIQKIEGAADAGMQFAGEPVPVDVQVPTASG